MLPDDDQMNPLLFYLEGKNESDGIYVSSPTLAALFVLKCFSKCDIGVVFVEDNQPGIISNEKSFKVLPENVPFNPAFVKYEKCPKMVQSCAFPALLNLETSWCVVGLSASLRCILKDAIFQEGDSTLARMLLGFRGGCLQACAEVSIWTKFCEIEILEMLNEIFLKDYSQCQEIIFPKHLLRFEVHLHHPPITHNALKWKQKVVKNSTENKNDISNLMQRKLSELPTLEHQYAEGLELTLADLLLYPAINIVLKKLNPYDNFDSVCPFILQWCNLVRGKQFVQRAQPFLENIIDSIPSHPIEQVAVIYPKVNDESLYKSDPNRYKPSWRAFTNQKDIDEAVKKLANLEVEDKIIDFNFLENNDIENASNILSSMSLSENECSNTIHMHKMNIRAGIKWCNLPDTISLKGQIPDSRYERKCQQLENMVLTVQSIAKEGDIIVDFCSGCGHLGILLAYFLPKCKVILVENKSNSLKRAFETVQAEQLENVQFYQCNLDYFNGKFDIGVCLHACGVSTDLVIKKCIDAKANFVCCPCCYGGVKINHILSYPRSSLYRDVFQIDTQEYLILSHSADQTHDSENHKTEQGMACMRYVDFDRLLCAQENNYKVLLTLMSPPTCSPKNHILIGIL